MFSSYIYKKLSPAWKIISLANQKYDDYPVNYLPACAAALVLRFFVEFLGNTVGMYAGWVASSTFAPEIKMNPNCSFIWGAIEGQETIVSIAKIHCSKH